tara:strand:- start:1590 stop:2558 length:969 start_codon:yes stop_codon:yes gene_type:complete
MSKEEDDSLVGKIVGAVVGPIITVGGVIVLSCLLITTIMRVQTTNGKKGEIRYPFTYGSNLEKAIECIRPDENKASCLRKAGSAGVIPERFGITGWKKREAFPGDWAVKYAIKCNLSLTEAFFIMFFDIIGSVFFPLSSKQTLEKLFNPSGKLDSLGTGGAILLVLKLGVILFGFSVVMPLLMFPLGIGGGILSVYLQQGGSGWNYVWAIVTGLIGIPGTYIIFNVIARLLGLGGDAGVKFSTVIKNFMKHFGWLVVFIFVVLELIVVVNLLGGLGQPAEDALRGATKNKVTPVVAGAITSIVVLLLFMITHPKLFKKANNE